MKQDTQDKFAAILAAQLAKNQTKVQPIKQTIEQPKEEIKHPENIAPMPELSDMTISDLINAAPIAPKVSIHVSKPKENEVTGISIEQYSDKSFAVKIDIEAILEQLGGKYNPYLKGGAGWIFPKTRLQNVKNRLSL